MFLLSSGILSFADSMISSPHLGIGEGPYFSSKTFPFIFLLLSKKNQAAYDISLGIQPTISATSFPFNLSFQATASGSCIKTILFAPCSQNKDCPIFTFFQEDFP